VIAKLAPIVQTPERMSAANIPLLTSVPPHAFHARALWMHWARLSSPRR